MADKYARIIARALGQPWALTADYMAIVQDLLIFRAMGGRLTAEEIRARIGEGDAPPPTANTHGAVAVIPVHGVIAHRTFDASSGMTSTEMIGKMISRASTDDDVKAIVLDVSSPGGTVEGVPELAAQILAARKKKYIVAHSNALMASAAYWIGSQASEIVATPSGEVGSIGVYSLHEDWSEHLAKNGIKITALSAGDRKLEGAPWTPMDEDAKAHFQTRVDEAYGEFIKAVSKGRGVSASEVKKTYGQGRVYSADEALTRGMIDRVGTLEETIARVAGGAARRSSGRAAASLDLDQAAQVDDDVHAHFDEVHAHANSELVDKLKAAAQDRDAIDVTLTLTDL